MLRLLSLLQTHRYWPGGELADRLEVSVRTLRRDVDRLRELGYPVQAQRGVDGGYQLAAGAAMPPLVLDDDEAVAIALGLQAAAHGAVAGIAESSVSALTKLTRSCRPGCAAGSTPCASRRRPRGGAVARPWASRRRAHDGGAGLPDTERLRFSYTAASGEQTEREVEPLRLVAVGRRWYLVAYDLARHDWRNFRLDRLERPVAGGVRFRPRDLPGGDAAEFVRLRVVSPPAVFEVVARVEAPADDVRRRIGAWSAVEPAGDDPDGSCVVRMTGDQLQWPVLGLSMLDAEFTVLEPPALRAHLAQVGARFTRAAGSPLPEA